MAAPTAGLHFTTELLETLASKGIDRADVVLHVGAGTFKPIDADDLTNHTMHEEFFEIPRRPPADWLPLVSVAVAGSWSGRRRSDQQKT